MLPSEICKEDIEIIGMDETHISSISFKKEWYHTDEDWEIRNNTYEKLVFFDSGADTRDAKIMIAMSVRHH